MIVGTAGHIDHGKTTLVRALTGVDTDRLPEEKRRGISIELGYAYLDAGRDGERIGFIDVPGHERLVATMLAGATGIDYALLLVAADDGPMPQTHEHLAVLSLLGVARGIVVVTKADRVDADRVDEVLREAQALLAGTALEGAPVLAVSAATGDGVDVLRQCLVEAARAPSPTSMRSTEVDDLGFRLAVDRVFSLAGVGTVVTGTAHAGHVAVGDLLQVVPGRTGAPVRVRSIHAQDVAVMAASAGQRVALGLVGLDRDDVARGRWLVAPDIVAASDRIDARVTVWRGETKSLRSGALVHAHLGAADVLASVAVLDAAGVIEPGASGRVQLVLREPLGAWRGDRLVLRDAAGSRAVAGGVVLDPAAPARYRRTAERLTVLDASETIGTATRIAALTQASPNGVDLAAVARAEGRLADATIALPASILEAAASGTSRWVLSSVHARPLQARLLDVLAVAHLQRPDEPGPDVARLRRVAAPRLAPALWQAVLDAAVVTGTVGTRVGHYFLPQHDAALSAAERRIVEKAWPRLLEGAFDPPWVRTLAADLREPEAAVRAALLRSAQRGELHQVVKDLYYPARTLARAAAIVRQIAGRDGELSAAAFRDASGLGRKRAIQIVEYFDRIGLLRRVGDAHRLRADCELFGGNSTNA